MKNLSPQSRAPENWPPCFITFRVTNQKRFPILIHAFEILKQEKLMLDKILYDDNDEQASEQKEKLVDNYHDQTVQKLEEVLFDLFDEQILAYFWRPSKQELQHHAQRWFATPVPQRLSDPALKHPWDFESMIDSVLIPGCDRRKKYERIQRRSSRFLVREKCCSSRSERTRCKTRCKKSQKRSSRRSTNGSPSREAWRVP